VNLPPPPIQPTSNDRVLYDWLYALYAELIGQTGNMALEMDTAGATANAAAARAAAAERLAADAALLSAPGAMDQMDAMRGELMALRAQNAELQKQVDGMALLMQSRAVDTDAIIRDAVLLSGGGQ
jgi:hypothetical protein